MAALRRQDHRVQHVSEPVARRDVGKHHVRGRRPVRVLHPPAQRSAGVCPRVQRAAASGGDGQAVRQGSRRDRRAARDVKQQHVAQLVDLQPGRHRLGGGEGGVVGRKDGEGAVGREGVGEARLRDSGEEAAQRGRGGDNVDEGAGRSTWTSRQANRINVFPGLHVGLSMHHDLSDEMRPKQAHVEPAAALRLVIAPPDLSRHLCTRHLERSDKASGVRWVGVLQDLDAAGVNWRRERKRQSVSGLVVVGGSPGASAICATDATVRRRACCLIRSVEASVLAVCRGVARVLDQGLAIASIDCDGLAKQDENRELAHAICGRASSGSALEGKLQRNSEMQMLDILCAGRH